MVGFICFGWMDKLGVGDGEILSFGTLDSFSCLSDDSHEIGDGELLLNLVGLHFLFPENL